MIFTKTLHYQQYSSHYSRHLEFHKAEHGPDPIRGLFVCIIGTRNY